MTSHALGGEEVFADESGSPAVAAATGVPVNVSDARERGLMARLRRRRAEQRLKRAQQGCARAFADLWRDHDRLVHAILISMVRDEDAEDLMQDVALSAWLHIRDVRSPDRFSAWLSTIARNAGRDALRSRRTVEEEPLPDEGIAAVDRHGDDEIANMVMAKIRRLPEAYREALTLRLVLGFGAEEIAQRTGMTPGSVRVNLCRGMSRLRKQLEDVTWLP